MVQGIIFNLAQGIKVYFLPFPLILNVWNKELLSNWYSLGWRKENIESFFLFEAPYSNVLMIALSSFGFTSICINTNFRQTIINQSQRFIFLFFCEFLWFSLANYARRNEVTTEITWERGICSNWDLKKQSMVISLGANSSISSIPSIIRVE